MTKENYKKRLTYNAVFLATILILFFFIFSIAKEFFKLNKINSEIKDLESQITQIENENLELSELLKFFNSDNFAEKKARTDLGLKKPDEKIVIIPNGNKTSAMLTTKDSTQIKKNNLQIWLDYFIN